MSLEEKYKQQYELGFPIFEKLFQLKRDDLIKVMNDVFQDENHILGLLNNNPTIVKTLRDDEPEEIKVYFYDVLRITYCGIEYKPEHNSPNMILKFDRFFNSEAIMKLIQHCDKSTEVKKE